MQNNVKWYRQINVQLIILMMLLFAAVTFTIGKANEVALRDIYEKDFTQRTLYTNSLVANTISGDFVKKYSELLANQPEAFKQKQAQFYHDRELLAQMTDENTSRAARTEVTRRLLDFEQEMNALKGEDYWKAAEELRYLKDVSKAKYLYVLAETGVKTEDGEPLITYIIDADDMGPSDSPLYDGLGTANTGEEMVYQILKTGEEMDYVSYYNDFYGELYYSYSPILDSGGNVVGVCGTDIDLVEMNEEIKNSQFVNNAIFISFVILFIALIYIFVSRVINRPLIALTHTAQQLADGNVYAQVPPTILERCNELGVLAEAVRDTGGVYQNMITNTQKLLDAVMMGRLDVRNGVLQYKGDIQKVLTQINDTLDTMVLFMNSIPESIFIMGEDQAVHFRNQQFLKFFGLMAADEFLAYFFRDGNGGEAYKQQNNTVSAWINGRCFSVTFTEINPDKGDIKNILVIAVDVTDLMAEKEKAQLAAKAKSDFLSSMSHEIRTPLNAIKGMTLIGKAAEETSRKNYSFEKIENASTHLMGVINDILDMSKIEANKLELSERPFNLERVLGNVLDIISFRLDEKQQTLHTHCDPSIPPLVGDDHRLAQVITNLLGNAVKFTPDGGSVYVDAERAGGTTDSCEIKITVKDTGIGISAEQQRRLFQSFQQADSSMSRSYGGTGLGLAISRSIVEIMGGRIWVESELGKGAAFSFTVRLKKSTEETACGVKSGLIHADAPPAVFPGKTILLAEDIEINREIVLMLLEATELTIDYAANGAEAVQMYKNQPERYDLILMDMQMPEMDGLEATRRIRAMDFPNAKTIPIVAMTANVFREDIEKCRQAGMDSHLGKPLDAEEVFTVLREYLNKKD